MRAQQALDDDAEGLDDEPTDEEEPFELPAPEYRKPQRTGFNAFKAGTRQPAAPAATITGELPWWAKTPLGAMTKTAEAELPRMQRSKEGHRVKGHVND